MPDLVRISITFLVILLLLRKKLDIGCVMLVASASLSLLYGMNMSSLFETVRNAAFNEITIKLLLSLSFIRMFELILKEKDVLTDMMSSVKGFFRNRKAVIVSMPMLIGMLPSLGGAYFSAPMVKEATEGLKMSSEEKAFINYWFRHPWEYILPLYPGVLLAAAISNVPLHTVITANLTCAAALIAMGFLLSMRRLEKRMPPAGADPGKKDSAGRAARSFLPLLGVLLLVIACRMELQYALLLIIGLLFLIYRYPLKDISRFMKYGFGRDVILLIFGIMLFKETLGTSGAVRNLSMFFVERNIPVVPVLCLLPFLTGLLTGLTTGFVGSTFPLLLSITGGASAAGMALAFAAGYIGVLLSPVHLCLILTKEYFNADLRGVYRKLIPGCGGIFLAAIARYMILR